MCEFLSVGGTVPGTYHSKPGKPGWTNNQDALAIEEEDGVLVAVVCDGCGSGAHSEVGAKLVSRLLAHFALEHMRGRDPEAEPDWRGLGERVLAHISVLAYAMGGSYTQVVSDYFLTTIVGVLITRRRAWIFSCGDSLALVNGEPSVYLQENLGADNAPRYLAYTLTNPMTTTNAYAIKRLYQTSTESLNHVLLGSDGLRDLTAVADQPMPGRDESVGSFDQFLDRRFVRNPDAIRRRLAMINRERADGKEGVPARIVPGRLSDDTTVVVITRVTQEKER